MPWLWFVGPLVFLVILFFVGLFPTTEERRFRRSVEEWLEEILGPLQAADSTGHRDGKKKRKVAKRRVRQTPPQFQPLLDEVGDGARITDVVLVPKLAYAAARAASSRAGSSHITIVGKLGAKSRPFVVKPVPIIDGQPVENRGVAFKKDAEFMDYFWVEAEDGDARAVRKWLRKSLRRTLCEHPEAWLRVDGRHFALTLYGAPTADEIDGLVDAADAIFAQHGADPGASLFGEEVPAPKKKKEAAPPPPRVASAIQAVLIDLSLYLVGAFFVALTWGAFESFHPASLFNSPDVHPAEPWQGGWTTKGFGAFVAAETILVLAYVTQTYLAAHRGTTLGRLLSGVRVVREDGERIDFWHGAWLRSQLLLLLPLVVAFVTADKPLTGASFVIALGQMPVIAAGAAAVVLGLASLATAKDGRGFLDRLAKTRMVQAPTWRPPPVQLGIADGAVDPVVVKRLSRVGLAIFALAAINILGAAFDYSKWIY